MCHAALRFSDNINAFKGTLELFKMIFGMGQTFLSSEYLQLIRLKYTFILCFTQKCKTRGVLFRADFLKKQFKDLLAPTDAIPICTFSGHEGIVYCLIANESALYSGSGDASVRVWDSKTFKSVGLLKGHKDSVTCLALDNAHLYSGSNDRTINVWNIISNQLVATLKGHTSSIEAHE